MKKILITLALLIAPVAVFAGSQVNTLYTATISTKAITDASGAADINLASVFVKSIDIANTTATAQTVTIYKNGASTTTITAVYVYQLPATVATYPVSLLDDESTVWSSNADYVSIPYFTVRTSTATNAATVNVKYWK